MRDLFWDYLAEQLRSVDCPRNRTYFYAVRLAAQELGTFLEVTAPDDGHDPAALNEDIVGQFVADQRRRARERLPSIRPSYNTKPPIVTEVTRKGTFDILRKVFRWALESGRTDEIGLDRAVVWALPAGGKLPERRRSPFSDETAKALADPANLELLDAADVTDRGAQDIWETLVATGRRAGEVIELRLDCITVHNGTPRLWHDQTKVGNFNEAIRIPEYVYKRLDARRNTTLASFERRYGRRPTAEERARMALFARRYKNPRGEYAVAHAWFSGLFRAWVDELELGAAVPHQARHTLATKLLAAGASLHHIKQFLGHVSQEMTEHYAKVALSEIDDVLQHVWVSGPGATRPGELLSSGVTPLPPEQAQALVLDLNRRSTPADGGICTFQVVVDGGACPWKLDCGNCEKFVMTGADLLYWRRKREHMYSLAERAPNDETADWLHQVFASNRPRHRRPRARPGRPRSPGGRAWPGPSSSAGLLPPTLERQLPDVRPRRRRRAAGACVSTESGRISAANQSRRCAIEVKLDRVRETLQAMRRARLPITYQTVARRSDVSRTFLYQNADAKTLMTTAITSARDRRRLTQAGHDAQLEASWQQRALNAEEALKTAYTEIGSQRDRIGILLGQIRDLQAEYTEDTVQRVSVENTTLKRRVRELTEETRNLGEKLQAARSNNRFLDKRLADLEAQLVDTGPPLS